MEIKHFCPICGCYDWKYEFSIGDICPCCGNELGFDDDIERPITNQEEYFKILKISMDLNEKGEEYPDYVKQFWENINYSEEEAWEILRNKWIKKGCPWKGTSKSLEPKNWGIELAKLQLHNIGMKLETYD